MITPCCHSYILLCDFGIVKYIIPKNKTGEKKTSNRAKPEKQKGRKKGGLGEGIFALLQLRIELFRFSLIKRNIKQKNFLFFLKEKLKAKELKNV